MNTDTITPMSLRSLCSQIALSTCMSNRMKLSLSLHRRLRPSATTWRITGHLAARIARNTPQPNPTRLPTTVLCSTGTNVKLRRLTSGHSLYPAIMSGHVCCRGIELARLVLSSPGPCPESLQFDGVDVESTDRYFTSVTAFQHSGSGTPCNALTPPRWRATLTTDPSVWSITTFMTVF